MTTTVIHDKYMITVISPDEVSHVFHDWGNGQYRYSRSDSKRTYTVTVESIPQFIEDLGGNAPDAISYNRGW